MSIAQLVKDTIAEQCPGTFSIYSGYGVNAGKNIPFPQGKQLECKRNVNGRVIKTVCQYEDNSKLTYTYNASTVQYKLIVS